MTRAAAFVVRGSASAEEVAAVLAVLAAGSPPDLDRRSCYERWRQARSAAIRSTSPEDPR